MNAQDWHNRIYEVSKEANVKSSLVFKAVYIALLGKESGPRAGWLLASLDAQFLKTRFLKASYASYFTPYSFVYWLLSEGIENKEGRNEQRRSKQEGRI